MHASEFSAHTSRQIFWVAFAATLLLKLVIAAGFPITGDEAFFYRWGVFRPGAAPTTRPWWAG